VGTRDRAWNICRRRRGRGTLRAYDHLSIKDYIMRRETVRVLVLGRFEERWPAVMAALDGCSKFEIVSANSTPDVIVELRHPQCWKKLPRGKRFPAVVVMPQLVSPCTEDEALDFHADAFEDDVEHLVDAVNRAHRLHKHQKSA